MLRAVAGTMIALMLAGPALADNSMGYKLLATQTAAGLKPQGGSLGMDIVQGVAIHEPGLTFELLKVRSVARGSPGAQAGLAAGDQIIAVDGFVFDSLRAFAAYVGSHSPGQQLSFDYIPSGGGPQQAQRVNVTVGQRNGAAPAPSTPNQPQASSGGLSTGAKVAIGAGAAALFGCYELGCFNHRAAAPGR